MQPSPRMTTKDCECGARMTWTRRGFIFPRWAFFRDLRWIVGKGWTARYQIEDTKA